MCGSVRPLKALRHGPPTQSHYVHFSMHNVVPRHLGTRPTVYVRAVNLPTCTKRCLRNLLPVGGGSLGMRLDALHQTNNVNLLPQKLL